MLLSVAMHAALGWPRPVLPFRDVARDSAATDVDWDVLGDGHAWHLAAVLTMPSRPPRILGGTQRRRRDPGSVRIRRARRGRSRHTGRTARDGRDGAVDPARDPGVREKAAYVRALAFPQRVHAGSVMRRERYLPPPDRTQHRTGAGSRVDDAPQPIGGSGVVSCRGSTRSKERVRSPDGLRLVAGTATLRDEIVRFAQSELNDDLLHRDADSSFSLEAWKKCAAFGIQGSRSRPSTEARVPTRSRSSLAMEALGYGCRDNGLIFSLERPDVVVRDAARPVRDRGAEAAVPAGALRRLR